MQKRSEILENMHKANVKTIMGFCLNLFAKTCDDRSEDELMEILALVEEQIIYSPERMKLALGEGFEYFKKITVDSNEGNR